MSPAEDSLPTPELDSAPSLPKRNVLSLWTVLAVQTLNAFNDNFVKMLIIAFAGASAPGTKLGDHMQVYLTAIFSLPYVLFAPFAGWLSDRYSKKTVIFWMQVLQVLVFAFFIMTLWVHSTQLTLALSLAGFFLLATQAAIFSPAKMGILKELVGSRRLGAASGALQMTMFFGVLSGAGLGGWLFGHRLEALHDPWASAWMPLLIVTAVSVLQILGSLGMQRTPSHEHVTFRREILWEHFAHLKLFFSNRPIRLAGLGITYFWFLANAISTILIGLGHEIHAGDPAAASKEFSLFSAMLGVGIISGSILTSIVCRRRIELGVLPLAGLGLAVGIGAVGFMAHSGAWLYGALVFVGVSGGCFMTPLYAFVQDRAKKDERARILSAVNLLDCLSAIVASMGLVEVLLWLNVSASNQFLVLVPLALGAALWVTKLLPQSLLKLILTTLVRTLYRLKGYHTDRLPKEGGVLLVLNHISYADAIVLGALCERDVRFVMTDTLYTVPWIHWFLKMFGTVPISPTKAKEAVRTVAECLKQGECICLFPEGQLTRTGFMSHLHKGFELMARMGDAQVQPVWLDGLWGSIFSFERGRFFKKVPRALPYRAAAAFGRPISGKEASTQTIRSAMLALGAEAFLIRAAAEKVPQLMGADGKMTSEVEARVAQINALRIFETSLLRESDILIVLLPPQHPMTATFLGAVPALRKIRAVASFAEMDSLSLGESRLIVIEDAASPSLLKNDLKARSLTVQLSSLTGWRSDPDSTDGHSYPAQYDAEHGLLLTLSVPDPEMPEKEAGAQLGRKTGSVGRVLPGIAVVETEDGLILRDLLPTTAVEIVLKNVAWDEQGFVFPRASTPAIFEKEPAVQAG